MCQTSAAGSFFSGAGNFLGAACTACTAGAYASSSGLPGCITCLLGSFASQTGLTACQTCAAGNYSSNPSLACTPCQAGKYASASGLSTCSACYPGTRSQRDSCLRPLLGWQVLLGLWALDLQPVHHWQGGHCKGPGNVLGVRCWQLCQWYRLESLCGLRHWHVRHCPRARLLLIMLQGH